MERLLLIVRNLRRHLRRTVLTSLTIGLATFVFVVLVSVPASMDTIISDASKTLRVMINNRTGPWYDLPPRYCDQIEKMPGVTACAALTGWPARYREDREGIQAFATSDNLSTVYPDYGITRDAAVGLLGNRRGAIVGTLLMKKYGWKIGDEITLKSASADGMELSFVIIDKIPSIRYPNSFVFRRAYWAEARKAHGMNDFDLAWFLVAGVDRAEHIPMVVKEIDETFKNSDYETRTQTEADFISNGLSAVGNIRGIVYSLSAVVMLTVLLIAANATAMMVRDRIGEVAVLRALGFSRLAVAVLLFGECAMLGVIGGLLGAAAALWMFAGGMNLGAVMGGGVGALIVPISVAAESVLIAIAVSVLSAVIPGIAALRIAPATAFRQIV